MTPFMSAVSGRAYPAAITILETAQKIAKGTWVLLIIGVFFQKFGISLCSDSLHSSHRMNCIDSFFVCSIACVWAKGVGATHVFTK